MSLLDMLTDLQGSLNMAEIGATGAMATAIGTEIYSVVWQHQAPNLEAFGIAASGIIAALGAAQRLRGDARSTGAST